MTHPDDPADEPADAPTGQEAEETAADVILRAYFRDSPEAARRLADEFGLTIPREPGVTGGDPPSAAG